MTMLIPPGKTGTEGSTSESISGEVTTLSLRAGNRAATHGKSAHH